jgi:hypothetical protein
MGLSFNIGLQTGFYYNLYEEFGGIIGPSISNWFYFLRIPIGIDILLIKDLYITIQSSFVYYLEKGYTTYFQFLINGGGLYGGSGIKKMFTRFWGLRVLLNINFKFTNAPPEYGDFWRQMFLDLDIGLIFRI